MSELDSETRRRLAVDLFNEVWRLLEQPGRSAEDDDRMLHAAHASRHHWSEVGTTVNLARGEWQCSRVYAVLGRAEPALHHARRCLHYAEQADDAEDWDLPYAYEALARAYGVGGDRAEADRWRALARETGERIADPEDREHFLEDVATL
jgi:hypothetical protein